MSDIRRLTEVEQLKFAILEHGVTVTDSARDFLNASTGGAAWTPADYASTSGLILALDGDVWVNAPIADYNPNFVAEPAYKLDVVDHHLAVLTKSLNVATQFWLPPAYHGTENDFGPLNRFAITHGDRVRLAPVRGCAMSCKFCDIPYERGEKYGIKPIPAMLEALRVALSDPVQPARHVLISGGTPRPGDHEFLREVYRKVLSAFPDFPVDIMMVPVPGLLDIEELKELGVNELSINIEVVDDTIAKRLMPQKYLQGIETYLNFIERASHILGPMRVRSMVMVGLEPLERTMWGVQEITNRGGLPVLSPFRPDPSTPLADMSPPSESLMSEAYAGAREIVEASGVGLAPFCPPCTHNTLSFGHDRLTTTPAYLHSKPRMV